MSLISTIPLAGGNGGKMGGKGATGILVVGAVLAGIYWAQSASHQFRSTVEATVARSLKEPESAIFSDVELYEHRSLACGKVNARNSFGGYTGDVQFAYFEGVSYMPGDRGDPNKFLWVNHECLRERIARLGRENPGVEFSEPGPFKGV